MDDEPKLSALMRLAQDGDADAYAELLQALIPMLRRLVRQRSRSGADEVDDVVQDVLLSVHTARATYDPQRPFLPWLHAIARNRMADAARLAVRRTAREVAVDNLDVTFLSPAANLFQEAYHARESLDRAVAQLPPGQRKAFRLLKREGLSLREAAAASGMSVAALKVATHRAILALRRILIR